MYVYIRWNGHRLPAVSICKLYIQYVYAACVSVSVSVSVSVAIYAWLFFNILLVTPICAVLIIMHVVLPLFSYSFTAAANKLQNVFRISYFESN